MPRAFPMGHRRRGMGYTSDNSVDIERADILTRHRGSTWYVDSNVPGGAAGNGDSWGGAVLTINAAVALAGADDLILVAPGHVETVIAAAGIAVSKAVSVIGLGRGRKRPVITFTTSTAATMTIAGSNVWIENMVFVCGIDAQVTMLLVTGSDVTIAGCEFDFAPSSAIQAALGITVGVATTGGVDRFRFYNNHCHGTLNAGCTNFIQIVGVATFGNDYEFIGNTIMGAFTTTLGCINNITVALVNLIIRHNVLANTTASATKVVVCLTGSTGMITDNRVGIGSGAAPFTIDAGWWSGNWSAAAVATNGTLV